MTSYRCGKCGRISTYQELKDFVSRQRFVRASWGAGKRENAENTDRDWSCPHCMGKLLFKTRAPVVRRVKAI